jgi:hypothetical protein
VHLRCAAGRAELAFAHGRHVSGKRVARLMRTAGPVGCHRRRRVGLTRRDPTPDRSPTSCAGKRGRATRFIARHQRYLFFPLLLLSVKGNCGGEAASCVSLFASAWGVIGR